MYFELFMFATHQVCNLLEVRESCCLRNEAAFLVRRSSTILFRSQDVRVLVQRA
jgi:hypothetical protein